MKFLKKLNNQEVVDFKNSKYSITLKNHIAYLSEYDLKVLKREIEIILQYQ